MHIIHVHSESPKKPPLGARCNGCGLCCLVEPCPLGVVLSRSRKGSCIALRWYADAQIYRCGAVSETSEVLKSQVPPAFAWIVPGLAWAVSKLAHRWIAAGAGCDSSLESEVHHFNENAS
jgi:hypothetical protein